MCGMAVARLHITAQDFYRMTPVEYYYAMKEYGKGQEFFHHTTYEAMRVQTWMLVNLQLDRGKKINDPRRLMPFNWDTPQKPQTVEEMKKILYAIAGKTNKTKTQ